MSRPRADANLINGYVMLCWCTDNTLESSVAGEKGKNSSRRNNETSRRILAVSGTQHGSVGGRSQKREDRRSLPNPKLASLSSSGKRIFETTTIMIDPRNMPNKPSTATKALDGLTGLAAERLNTRSRVDPTPRSFKPSYLR